MLQATTTGAYESFIIQDDSANDKDDQLLVRYHHQKQETVYCGFDPTAISLHLGNLLPFMSALWFAVNGHRFIAVVGGATGAIGDPSGRSTERNALEESARVKNMEAITSQIETLIKNASNYMERRGLGKLQLAGTKSTASSASAFASSPSAWTDAGDNAMILNNYDWFKNMSMLEFMGSVGKHARVSIMLSRDSVKSRLGGAGGESVTTSSSLSPSSSDENSGVSFTEFTYQLLQGYDFWHLYTHHDCRYQIGGSDQWGNIIAGVDLIRRKRAAAVTSESSSSSRTSSEYSTSTSTPVTISSNAAHGITSPLLLSSTGAKFGKSAGNAMYLCPTLVSPYELYQYLRRTPDADVRMLLCALTLLPIEQIDAALNSNGSSTGKAEECIGQRLLATEVVELVHGEEAARRAKIMSMVLFDGEFTSSSSSSPSTPSSCLISAEEIIDAFKDSSDDIFMKFARDAVIGKNIVDAAAAVGATASKASARKLIKSGGLYLNNIKITTSETIVLESVHTIQGKICLFRTGKSNYRVIQLI